MWFLTLLPGEFMTWIANLILLIGATLTTLGFFIHKIQVPMLYQYQLLFRIAGILVLCYGVYLRGGISVEEQWRERAEILEKQAREAEARFAETNQKLDKAIVERDFAVATRGKNTIKTITEWRDKDPKEITRDMAPEQAAEYERRLAELKSYIEKCPVPELVIKEHNLNIKEQNQIRGWTGEFK